MDAPLLEISNLSVSFPAIYGPVPVLDDVQLDLRVGETLGLVGESGSGKSLLGTTILGLTPGSAEVRGSVVLAGHDMVILSNRDERSVRGNVVSLITQDALSALNPNRRVGAHFRDLWFAARLRPRNAWRQRATEILRQVALREPERIMRKYPDELSGGMRQRVLIGLAVFRQPKLLIADEPTTALDRVTADEVLALLRRLRHELNMAMIFISHDLVTVRQVCDRVAVMYAGQVCEIGDKDEVLRLPAHRYTEALIESARSLRRAEYPVVTIPGVVPSPTEFIAGCRFRDRCAYATAACVHPPEVGANGHRGWCAHPPRWN